MVSIIVAVYNAEKYLEYCVRSILAQTYQDIEIILINDGSTDDSLAVCSNLADMDSRVRVISKKNEGESETRNCGIREAKGEYITFVDNDDYVPPTFVEAMLEQIQESGADLCICSYYVVDDTQKKLDWYTPRLEDGRLLSALEAEKRYLSSYDIEGFPWNKLVKKQLYIQNGIRYEGAYPADMGATFELLRHCKQVVLCDKKLYYYRQNEESAVHTMNVDKVIGMIQALSQIRDRAIEDGLMAEGERYFIHHMTRFLYDDLRMKDYYGESWEEVRKAYLNEDYMKYSFVKKIRMIGSSRFKDRYKIIIKLFLMKQRGVLTL